MFEIDFSLLSNEELALLATQKITTCEHKWQIEIWKFIQSWLNQSENFIYVTTSGSTGEPKQILHKKEFVRNSSTMTCNALQIKVGSNSLLCLPAEKISGAMMIVRSMMNKMKMICIEPSAHPLIYLQEISTPIHFAAFTPMQFYDIVNDYKTFITAEKIDKIILGGETISANLQSVIRTMNNAVYATFGMTETISHIALKKLTGTEKNQYYTTLPGITVSYTENNCLVVHAAMLGIQQLTTNDIIKAISKTQFEWLGRLDNVINTGGVKVHPEKIEEILAPYFSVPFFIDKSNNEKTGERVIIVIEQTSITEQELQSFKQAFTKLPRHYQPREIWLADALVKTANGKLNRLQSISAVKSKVVF